MLRVYKMPNGRTYQYEEGEQPESAVLVERAADKSETPETRAAKAPAKRAAAAKSKGASE